MAKRSSIWKWSKALTVATCKECAGDIWPADKILIAIEKLSPDCVSGKRWTQRITFCEGCGELYIESQELGEDANQT